MLFWPNLTLALAKDLSSLAYHPINLGTNHQDPKEHMKMKMAWLAKTKNQALFIHLELGIPEAHNYEGTKTMKIKK